MDTETGAYRRILVATDGSEEAQRAVGRAVALAKLFGAELSVISVMESPRFPMFTPETAEMVAEYRQMVERAADEAVARARAGGIEPRLRRVVEGDVRESIMAMAEELDADLIVVGSHGWSRLERLLLGSTADYLVHHAPCSVLVVRAGDRG